MELEYLVLIVGLDMGWPDEAYMQGDKHRALQTFLGPAFASPHTLPRGRATHLCHGAGDQL